MKILLDECVTKRLKPFLPDEEVFTVTEMRWNGIKNGKLLSFCVENGFDLLLTIYKNMMHQQTLDKFAITIVVLNSITSKIEELKLFLPSFHAQANRLQKHIDEEGEHRTNDVTSAFNFVRHSFTLKRRPRAETGALLIM
jgi:hypothetical protein